LIIFWKSSKLTEDIEFCSIDRFGSIEPNFLQKKKNSENFAYGSPWQNRISPTESGSVRFGSKFYLSSIVSL
jgi:hypothetical protein